MADFITKIKRKEQIAQDTMAFYMEKPEGLTYTAGQHPTFRLINSSETDQEGDSRTFSFITIPSDNEIGFATRMRDTAFKRYLKNNAIGSSIEIKNPRGSMILPVDAKRPIVILTGGIGITPFISIIREAAYRKIGQKITLFYANKTIDQTAFLPELNQLTKENPDFKFIPIMTREDAGKWPGETGHITIEMLTKYIPNLDNTIFYIAGPTNMVKAMTELLVNSGVDPIFIKTEDYGEYK